MQIVLYKEGQRQAYFYFYFDFEERTESGWERWDDYGYFTNLTPSDFLCPEGEDPCLPITLAALNN